jgi:hypothetical protein
MSSTLPNLDLLRLCCSYLSAKTASLYPWFRQHNSIQLALAIDDGR